MEKVNDLDQEQIKARKAERVTRLESVKTIEKLLQKEITELDTKNDRQPATRPKDDNLKSKQDLQDELDNLGQTLMIFNGEVVEIKAKMKKLMEILRKKP